MRRVPISRPCARPSLRLQNDSEFTVSEPRPDASNSLLDMVRWAAGGVVLLSTTSSPAGFGPDRQFILP
jgi:hypothetical protein